MSNSFESPDGQRVSFIELFFDLIYVYSITQIVYLISNNFTFTGVFQGLLIFWLVWWSWTQVAWALNAANTENNYIQIATMFMTMIAFFMVITIPGAFKDKAFWFVLSYILIRSVALTVYFIAGKNNQNRSHAIKIFTLASLSGMFFSLLGGLSDVNLRYILWSLVIFFDFVAAYIAGKNEGWDLDPDHFSERHGLFVIIALGESLIVTASGFQSSNWDFKLISISFLAVLIIGAFWWNYFIQTKPILDKIFEEKNGPDQSNYARDTYSLIHVIIISGIISYAVGLEHLLTNWQAVISLDVKLAVLIGILLYFGGLILSIYRATHHVNMIKVIFIILSSLIISVINIPDSLILFTLLTGFVLIMLVIIDNDSKNLINHLSLNQSK